MRCVWQSTKPGMTTLPRASIDAAVGAVDLLLNFIRLASRDDAVACDQDAAIDDASDAVRRIRRDGQQLGGVLDQ